MSQPSTNHHDKVLFPIRLNLQEIQMKLLCGNTDTSPTLRAFYKEAVQVLIFFRDQIKDRSSVMCCTTVTLSVIISLRHYIRTHDEVMYDMISLYIKSHFWADAENHTIGRALDEKLAQLGVLARDHVKAVTQVEQATEASSNKPSQNLDVLRQRVTLVENCHLDIPPATRSVQSISRKHAIPHVQGPVKVIAESSFTIEDKNLEHTVESAHGIADVDHCYDADKDDDDTFSLDIPNSIVVLPAVEVTNISDSMSSNHALNQNGGDEQRRDQYRKGRIHRTKSVFPIPPRKNKVNVLAERGNLDIDSDFQDRISRAGRHTLKTLMLRQFDGKASKFNMISGSRICRCGEMDKVGNEENGPTEIEDMASLIQIA